MSRLPPLPSLKDFIHMYRLRAKKILSQNYLMDMNLTRKIVRKSGRMNEAHVIEIGPGPGGITRAILENNNVKSLDVVEIDQRFIPPLQHLGEASEGRLHIHREDILKIDIMDIWKDYLSEKKSWMDVNECDNFHIIDMSYRRGAWEFGRVPLTLTFQKEVGKRICSIIDSKSRSRISIMSQYISQPEYLFEIPGSCFVPSPKVDVAVIRFIPRIEPLIPCSFELVEKIARHIFHYRQKYVVKCIKTLYPKELSNKLSEKLLIKCNIDERTTSYRLGMIDFSRICQEYERQCLEIPGLFLYDFRHNKKELKELELLENKFPPLLKHEFNRFEDGVSLSKSKEYLL